MKRKLVRSNLLSYLIRLALGLFVGYELSFTPTPLLHYLLYKDVFSMLWLLGIISLVLITACGVVFLPKPFALTKKQARKTLFLGISVSSFFLGLWAFLNYPSIISSNYSWVLGNGAINVHLSGTGGVDVTTASIVFFIATILWDGLMGSFFAVLEHLLT